MKLSEKYEKIIMKKYCISSIDDVYDVYLVCDIEEMNFFVEHSYRAVIEDKDKLNALLHNDELAHCVRRTALSLLSHGTYEISIGAIFYVMLPVFDDIEGQNLCYYNKNA